MVARTAFAAHERTGETAFRRKGLVGEWRREWSRFERLLFSAAAGETLEVTGYAPAGDAQAGAAAPARAHAIREAQALHVSEPEPVDLSFEAFGVRVGVRASPALAEGVVSALPPGASLVPSGNRRVRWNVVARDDGSCDVTCGGTAVVRGVEPSRALDALETKLRHWVAEKARDRIFVHAAVVAAGGRALLVPGASRSGKTTLAAALVRAGALYYSDEYAVLDLDGRVHPYPKRLSVRIDGGTEVVETPVAELGGVTGRAPIPVALIVLTHHVAGAAWAPRELTPAEGALGLLANTVVARTRPADSLRTLQAACRTATVLEGDRGEAQATAAALLHELGTGAARRPTCEAQAAAGAQDGDATRTQR